MILKDIIALLEAWASPSLQESYDNSGLIVGDKNGDVKKALITLDCVESIIDEAIETNCQLVIAHHPIVFSGMKSITGKNYVERTILKAIKNDIAIYAIHTNLDNIHTGVNAMIADKLGLKNTNILAPKKQMLKKLVTYIPENDFENVSNSIFDAGAGHIGNYSHCGFSTTGEGSFMGNSNSNPSIGIVGKLEKVTERRFETVFPGHFEIPVIRALKSAHPYEEVAYDIYTLENEHSNIGAGMVGDLEEEIDIKTFLSLVKDRFDLKFLKHTNYTKPIRRVALCGGSGSFLRFHAAASGADAFISSDFKYHEWFDAEEKLSYIDIGHYETEQFTKQLISGFLEKNAVSLQTQISKQNTNPVKYF